MAETMSHVEGVLWRIAELGARCSQHDATGARAPLWAELEEAIAGLEAEFDQARATQEGAPAQVRSLQGRLKVAQQQRDQERARNQECFADAEAARRERDRERQKARKAMAATIAAKDAAAAAVADADRAKAATAEARSRAAAAEAAVKRARAERDAAVAARDEAVAARDEALSALEEAVARGDRAVAAHDVALLARDGAIRARDEAVRALEAAQARIVELRALLDAAGADRRQTVDPPARDDAVVVLPEVLLPEAPAGPVVPARRVSWQPTWSEWAKPETAGVADVDLTERAAGVAPDGAGTAGRNVPVADPADGEEAGEPRYLNVAATIAQLLPDDLGPLLVPGASVVRREGRLFATVAVPAHRGRAVPDADGGQAERFEDAGFRVDWASGAPLGV